VKVPTVFRLGSTTPCEAKVEINSIEAVQNSSSKMRMKKCFAEGKVRTAEYFTAKDVKELTTQAAKITGGWKSKLVCKSFFGSRGRGNYLIDNEAKLIEWTKGKDLSGYVYERFYNFTKEYRLHVTEDGCFYTCRKLLKEGTPEQNKWYRNDSNCVWILEENPSFDKPKNWKDIETECVKALKAVKLDVGACDVKVSKDGEFIVIEINSAPSLGEITLQKYLETIPKLVNKKVG